MYQDSKDGISIKAILDRRQTKKNGLHAVRIQVIHRRIVKLYPTGKDLSWEEWNKLPCARRSELARTRESIQSTFKPVVKVVEDLSSNGEFSFDMLKIRLGRASGGTLIEGFEQKIESLKQRNKIETALYYKDVRNSIIRYAGKSVPYESVTINWVYGYEQFLINNSNSPATIAMRMRGLRVIMNMASR